MTTTPNPEPATHGTNEEATKEQWVTLRAAAERTGVAVGTLRKWRSRGLIESGTEPGPTGPRITVPLAAVVALARERGAGDVAAVVPTSPPIPTAAPPDAPTMALVPKAVADQLDQLLAIAAAYGEAGERVGRAEAERDAYRARLDDARATIAAKATAEREAAIERQKREAAERDARELRAALQGELERPWWRRRRRPILPEDPDSFTRFPSVED